MSQTIPCACRRKFQSGRELVRADPRSSESWSGRDKRAGVIETATLNEQGPLECCRCKGLYPEQVDPWKGAVLGGSADAHLLSRDERNPWQQQEEKGARHCASAAPERKSGRGGAGLEKSYGDQEERPGPMSTRETRSLVLVLITEAVGGRRGSRRTVLRDPGSGAAQLSSPHRQRHRADG